MSGIRILDQRITSNCIVESFGIVAGEELSGATHLIALLASNAQISLRNDLDEGGEGCTTIRRSENGYQSKNGGHGWQGEWATIAPDSIRKKIAELAPLNRGEHWSSEGIINRAIGG